jgi:hypothetical protein
MWVYRNNLGPAEEGTMRKSISAAIAAAFLTAAGAASAACSPGQANGCVNLDLAPKVSQDIVGTKPLSPRPKAAPAGAAKVPYTGVTVGFSDKVRRAPEIGYRWALD